MDEVETAISETTIKHSVQTRFRIDEKQRIPYARTEHNLLEIMESDQFPKKFEKYGVIRPYSKLANEKRAEWKRKMEESSGSSSGDGGENKEQVGELPLSILYHHYHLAFDAQSIMATAEDVPIKDLKDMPSGEQEKNATAAAGAEANASAEKTAADATTTNTETTTTTDSSSTSTPPPPSSSTPPPPPPPPAAPAAQKPSIESSKQLRSEIKETLHDFMDEYLDEAMLMFHKSVPNIKHKLCYELTEVCKPKKRSSKKGGAAAKKKTTTTTKKKEEETKKESSQSNESGVKKEEEKEKGKEEL